MQKLQFLRYAIFLNRAYEYLFKKKQAICMSTAYYVALPFHEIVVCKFLILNTHAISKPLHHVRAFKGLSCST